MSAPLTVWQIGDGKPGHENQSLGLIEAIGRVRPCEHHRIDVSAEGNFWSRSKAARLQAEALPAPDLVLGAGHATHFPIWRLGKMGKMSGTPTVVLMKPSLPMRFFDLCIVPRHDFPNAASDESKLILTDGALNRVVVGEGERQGRLILLGGPSKHHGWDGDAMMNSLKELASEGEWQLTDSRRTPEGFVDRIRTELPQIQVHPHTETGPDWLPQILQKVDECWVTEDSVSMTYEALSSGAKVGLLSVPRLRDDARVLRGLDGLIRQGRLTSLSDWLGAGRQLGEAQPLREADRCAPLVLDLV